MRTIYVRRQLETARTLTVRKTAFAQGSEGPQFGVIRRTRTETLVFVLENA